HSDNGRRDEGGAGGRQRSEAHGNDIIYKIDVRQEQEEDVCRRSLIARGDARELLSDRFRIALTSSTDTERANIFPDAGSSFYGMVAPTPVGLRLFDG